MNIGIIGLPKSGKTTIFNALTGLDAEVADYASAKIEPNVGVVDVGDPRVDRLSEMYKPRRTIYATIEFIDFVTGPGKGGGPTAGGGGSAGGGAGKGATPAEGGGMFSGEGIGLIKNADALLVVLRNFDNPALNEVYGAPDAVRDLETVASELLLADQVLAERRLERLEGDHKRGKKSSQSEAEEKLMRRVVEQLEAGKPIRDLELTSDEKAILSGFRFLTEKPVLVVLNSEEGNYGQNEDTISALESQFPVIEFAGNFEMELSRLDEEDAPAFMEDMGITESARTRLTSFAYRLLGYISFFTVGEDEVRAWTILDGENAQEAAGTIHTDLAKGFIRAEVFSYDDLISAGSEKGVKDKGLFRLEGKQYRVKDGDILHVRFNV